MTCATERNDGREEPCSCLKKWRRELGPIRHFVFVMLEYRRRLPHFIPEGATFAICIRLAGALQPNGPKWLREPQIAGLVTEALLYGERAGKYVLHAFVIMPTHVHLVMQPRLPLPSVMRWLKSRTGRVANRLLGRLGAFWQDESYDRVIRNSEELHKTIDYVHNNPVRSGLVKTPEQWSWSSASPKHSERAAATLTDPSLKS